jgi:hypothetical protein
VNKKEKYKQENPKTNTLKNMKRENMGIQVTVEIVEEIF